MPEHRQIVGDPPAHGRGLGQRLGIDRATIVAIVDDMENAGLVERTRAPEGRRCYLLTLTRTGHAKQRHGRGVVHEAERALLEALNEQERGTLTELLARALFFQT